MLYYAVPHRIVPYHMHQHPRTGDMAFTSLCCFVQPQTTRSSIQYALGGLGTITFPKFAAMFELVAGFDLSAG